MNHLAEDPAQQTLVEALDAAQPAATLLWADRLSARVDGVEHLVDDAVSAAALGIETDVLPSGERAWQRVILMMPRSKETFRLRLAWAAARLVPGGELWVAGHQRDGIKSAAKPLASVVGGPAHVLRTKRRCRVVMGRLVGAAPAAPPLDAVAVGFDVGFRGDAFQVQSLPGTFSHGRLDPGTARLLSVLEGRPPEMKFKRAADPGCGAGVIATALKRMRPRARVDLCDVSAVACASARRTLELNRLEGTSVIQAGIDSLQKRHYDLVVANPPRHIGRAHAHALCASFVRQAAGLLVKGGHLVLVANHSKAISAALDESFFSVEVSHHDNAYRVWTATA